jgi:hypothetical protein
MRWLRGESPDSSFDRLRSGFRTSSLKTRLMVGLIPPVVVIMIITGYVTYYISKQSISTAVERATRLQTVAVGNEIEMLLDRCRQDLSNLAQEAVTPGLLQRFLARPQVSGGMEYAEAAFIAQKSTDHIVYVAKGAHIAQVPDRLLPTIKPNPFIYYDEVAKLSPGQVWLSPITEVESPLPEPQNREQQQSLDHHEHSDRPPEDPGEQAIDRMTEIRCGGEG